MKKLYLILSSLFLINFNSVFANSYELNGDIIKSDANKSIHTTSIVLYVILCFLIVFGGYLIYTDSAPKKGKIIIVVSVLCLFAIRLISGMLLVFNSSSI